ncbi:MAG: cytochrome C [Gemmatimonadales bacterium]
MRWHRSPALLVFLIAAAGPLRAAGPGDAARAYAWSYAATHGATNIHFATIPSFSRQTGLACNACHTAFPRLTAFGRLFKLNGYTLTGLQVVTAGAEGERQSLKLDLIPPISAMVVSSFTQVSKDVPGTQNGGAQLPQQLSVFLGEAITPRLGTFLQLTYDPAAGTIGMDNLDIRYANHTHLASHQLLYGVTLNNNPSVQDVWNTTPAWRFPFMSSAVAPAPAAASLIDGGQSQQVAGLGAYGLWNNLLYAEVSVYRSAAQGGPNPPDATSAMTIKGGAPYWRVALQHQWGKNYFEVGSYGMSTALWPVGVAGPTDRYADVGFDAQYERSLGGGNLTLHTTYIAENQHLNGSVGLGAASNLTDKLNTFRIDGSVLTAERIGLTLAYFSTTGDADALRYPATPVGGSATGSPNSDGMMAEIEALPWLNTRFALQYVAYTRFNGGSTGYDGSGRNASDNNTLYLYTWLVF